MRESEGSVGSRPYAFAVGTTMSDELSHESQHGGKIADRLSLQINDTRNPAHGSSLPQFS
jgi:hypothetical protein